MNVALSLPPCVFLAGATATGKTSLAVELALELGAEVVSADSMLVYRHMDVGTAKPTVGQRRGVAHHLIDVVDPDGHYDAATFCGQALEALSGMAARGVPAVVAGGTGLYLRALRQGLAEAPAADPEFRRQIESQAVEHGTEALHARLAAADPDTAAVVHRNDLVRIERALEILHVTGRPASRVRAEHGFATNRLDALYLVLDVEPDALRERIRARAGRMVEAGLLDEVRALLGMGYGPALRPMEALNYRHAVAHLDGRYDVREMLERMVNDTWHFAKRQIRWFRTEKGARLVAPDLSALARESASYLGRGLGR